MNQVLSAIRLIVSLYPLIKESIMSFQALFPGAGTAKLTLLLNVVEEASKAEKALTDLFTQASTSLAPVLSAVVDLTKGKTATPPPAVPPVSP